MSEELKFSDEKRLILKSGLFNSDYYLSTNADIKSAGVDPLGHYLEYGSFEGREASAAFNTQFYLDQYPDVKESGQNPLIHYIKHGEKAGRKCLPPKKEILNTSVSKKKAFQFNYNIERAVISTYNGIDLGLVTISGWCHSDNLHINPEVVLIVDGEFYDKVKMTIPREDVIDIHGQSSFPNGFSITFQTTENNHLFSLVEKKTNTDLLSDNLKALKKVDLKSGEYESWVAYQNIPTDLKKEISKKTGCLNFSANSYDEIQFSMLEFLSRPQQQDNGFNVFGYFSKICGISVAGRAFVDSLIEKKENLSLFDYFEPTHKRISKLEELKYSKYYYNSLKYKTNIFLVDTQVVGHLHSALPIIFNNKRNILSFWWEFESGFEDRIEILNNFDEIYVFSDFIKNILSSIENRKFKITKIKYPFYKDWLIEEDVLTIRERYHLQGKFCFFFNFDYASGYKRKNPEAILKALYEEFPSDKDVVFVVKTSNIEGFNEKEDKFKKLIQHYRLNERVVIIKKAISKNSFMSLLNAMDCYISLHRGEGLGLGILESYALGKPVIATNYGGNTEYMDNPLGYPVPYSLVPANDDYSVYKNVKEWAEPDNNYAKKHMRNLYNNILSKKSDI